MGSVVWTSPPSWCQWNYRYRGNYRRFLLARPIAYNAITSTVIEVSDLH